MERVRRSGVEEINLVDIIKVLLRKVWLIILSGMIAGLGVFAVTKEFVQPKYTAGISLYVNNSKNSVADNITSSDISASIMLTNTYLAIIQSDAILEEVLEKADSEISTEEFKEQIRAVSVSNTEVMSIQITTTDADESAMLANYMADVVTEKMPDIVEGSSVKILEHAKVPIKKSSPSYAKRMIVGAFIGCFLATILIIIFALSDNHIHGEKDLARWDYPILGVIPDMNRKSKSKYQYYSKTYDKRK